MSIIEIGKNKRSRLGFFQLITGRFINMITREKRSIKPPECRGGILADEMGMVLKPP